MGSYHRRLMMATPPLPSKEEIDRIVIERKALGMAVFDSSNAPTGIVRSPGPSETAREPSDKGGFSITLDALPLPNAEGVCRMLVVEPKPRDEATAQSNSARAKQAMGGAGIDDDMPF